MNELEKLALHFRTSNAPLVASNLLIITDKGDFKGHGTLTVKNDKIILTAITAEKLPDIHGGYNYENFWNIGGIIDNKFPFWSKGLPHNWHEYGGRYSIRSSNFSLCRIHYIATHFEQERFKDAILEAINSENIIDPSIDEAFAYFTNYKLIGCNGITETTSLNPVTGKCKTSKTDTISGKFGPYEYGLVQKNNDCEVYLRLQEGETSDNLKLTFDALLQAIAFAHGQHTWPQWQQTSKEFKTISEWTRAPATASRNKYPPMTDRACFHGDTMQLFLENAMNCFLSESEFTKGFKHLLFLAREAGASATPFSTGLLGLCSTLEGLIRLLSRQHQLQSLSSEMQIFESTRKNILEYLKKDESLDSNAVERFQGIIKSAKFERLIELFKQLSDHYSLPWEKMSLSLEAWKRHRNILAHGGESQDPDLEALFDKSRISGAINVFAASYIGYKGYIPISPIEDSYISL